MSLVVRGTLANFRWTKFGKKLMGMPIEPRASKGFRRHTRRLKASKGRAT
jgi:hypothetical protein